MGKCNIDHSLVDVQKKLQEQKAFLPESLAVKLENHLTEALSQESLNEIFHLLKKYDLGSKMERKKREEKLATYL